jgi:hypothetical protein
VEPGHYRLTLLATARGKRVRVLATARVRVRRNRTAPVAFQLSVR